MSLHSNIVSLKLGSAFFQTKVKNKIIRQHWQGKLSLQTSLLIIFFGLLFVLNFLEPWFLNTFFTDPQQRIYATLISLSITKLIIFPWQLIGLLRASDNDYLKQGNVSKTRFIQLLMVLAIAYVLAYSISLIQAATYNKKQQDLATEFNNFQKQDKNYKLTLRNHKSQLVISGEIEIGITKAVSNILKQNPTNIINCFK